MNNYYVDTHKSRLSPILVSDLSQELQFRNLFNHSIRADDYDNLVDDYSNLLKSLSSLDYSLSVKSNYNTVLNISNYVSTHDALLFRISITPIRCSISIPIISPVT